MAVSSYFSCEEVMFVKILVSACLLGSKCRYDGGAKPDARVIALGAEHTLVPVCPERLGGLEAPREPSEISGSRVAGRDGRDVTAEFERGARRALEAARRFGCSCAILKERSPSCGSSRSTTAASRGASCLAPASRRLC